MSLRCYVLYTGCHQLPTALQHLVFHLQRQLPGSAKIRRQIEQMGNCFLSLWKSGGFLSFSYPALRKQDLSRIFVKNKVSLPTAQKLLIHWLRHLARAVEQTKWVLTFSYSESAEIPLPRNQGGGFSYYRQICAWSVPISPLPPPFSPQIPIWVWAIFPVQNSTFFCKAYSFQKFAFPTVTVSAEYVTGHGGAAAFPLPHGRNFLRCLLLWPQLRVKLTGKSWPEHMQPSLTKYWCCLLTVRRKKMFFLFFVCAFNNSQNTKTTHSWRPHENLKTFPSASDSLMLCHSSES